MTTGGRIPVLWLCGPPGVGKSTVSWQIYTELAGAGARVAFADSDQLGMCGPAPAGDPERQQIKTLNFRSVLANFRSAGARCVIVNGVLDPAGLAPGLLPDADVTSCRLRASADEVVRRFLARQGQRDDAGDTLREIRTEVRRMDQSGVADVCVDTTGLAAGDVAAAVRAACHRWPGFTGDPPDMAGRSDAAGQAGTAGRFPVRHCARAGGRVALITGPAGVGKSTIGFRCYLDCLRAGLTAGYVDLRQVGFLGPPGESNAGHHRLKAGNLAAVWHNYRAAGATHLVATGPIGGRPDVQLYAEALTGAGLGVVRLRAGRQELARRITSRSAGGSWPEPGDPLRGRSACFLARVARQAAEDQAAQDHAAQDQAAQDHAAQDQAAQDQATQDQATQDAGAGDWLGSGGLAIDTTGRSPEESARLIADALGWPPTRPM